MARDCRRVGLWSNPPASASAIRASVFVFFTGENFVFNITNAEGGGVVVELLLPFHSARRFRVKGVSLCREFAR